MKPEMITLKHGDTTIKMPAESLAKLAIGSVLLKCCHLLQMPTRSMLTPFLSLVRYGRARVATTVAWSLPTETSQRTT